MPPPPMPVLLATKKKKKREKKLEIIHIWRGGEKEIRLMISGNPDGNWFALSIFYYTYKDGPKITYTLYPHRVINDNIIITCTLCAGQLLSTGRMHISVIIIIIIIRHEIQYILTLQYSM